MAMNIQANMGKVDCIGRGALGLLLIANSLSSKTVSPLKILIGSLFLLYGITGLDPLLKKFGGSTIVGSENSLLNLFKQTLPGQGINPILTQQPFPKKPLQSLDGTFVNNTCIQ